MAATSRRTRRSGYHRRGAGALFTVVAIVAAFATAASTTKGLRDQFDAGLAADELLEQSREIAEQSRQIMKLKIQLMHKQGNIDQDDYELALKKIDAPHNRQVFEDMVSDLQRQQNDLGVQGLVTFSYNAAINLGFAHVGNSISAGATYAERVILGKQLRKYLNMFNDLGSLTLTVGQEAAGRDHPFVLTPEQFMLALAEAERRLQAGDEDGEMRTAIRRQVRDFFDKWHTANIGATFPNAAARAEFEKNRDAYRNKCHAAFQQFISGDLAKEAWIVEPEGLDAYAWACLKADLFYRQTFPEGDQLYQVEWAEARDKPLRTNQGHPVRLKRELRTDEFTGDEKIVFTLILPPSITAESLAKYNFPRNGRLEFPMEEVKIQSDTTFQYVNRGPEAKLLVEIHADSQLESIKVIRSGIVAALNLKGTAAKKVLADVEKLTLKAEEATVTAEPSASAAGELIVMVSGTLVLSGPDVNGNWETKRMPVNRTFRAVPVEE